MNGRPHAADAMGLPHLLAARHQHHPPPAVLQDVVHLFRVNRVLEVEQLRDWVPQRRQYSRTNRSPSGYGSGRSSTPLMTVKIAVAEPMPTANAITASTATPGAVFQEAQACEKADSTSP